MGIISILTRVFGPIVEKNEEIFSYLRESFPKSGLNMPFLSYASLTLFFSLLSFFSVFTLSYLLLTRFFSSTLIPLTYAILAGMLSSSLTFTILYFYPSFRVSFRKRNIENVLPFLLIHMGALSECGLPPYQMFKLISKFEEYGEVSKEFKKIVRNIEEFGLDPLTAIKEVANKTPSEELQQLLMGFVTTTESGGNIKLYLKTVGEQTLLDYRKRREKYIRTLDIMSEIYTGIIVASPLFLVAMLAIMSMIQPTLGGFTIRELVWLGTYVAIPIINILFLLILHTMEVEM